MKIVKLRNPLHNGARAQGKLFICEIYNFPRFCAYFVFYTILYNVESLSQHETIPLWLWLVCIAPFFFHHIHILLPFIPPSFVCDFARVVFCCFQHRELALLEAQSNTKQHKRAAKVTRLMSSTAVMMVITLIKKKHQQKQRKILKNSLIQTEVNCEICTYLFWMLFSWSNHRSPTRPCTSWDWAMRTPWSAWWAAVTWYWSIIDCSSARSADRRSDPADDVNLPANVDTTRLDCAAASTTHESTDDDDCCWVSVVYRISSRWRASSPSDSCWCWCCSSGSASCFAALFVRPSFSIHGLLKTPIIECNI